MVTLRLDALGARYGRNPVLSDITTAAFKGGEVVALIGPNAAGKSSLFKRMAGIIDGSGRAVIEGARGNGIVYMPQDSATNAVLTVYESVLLARKQDASWSVGQADLAIADEVLGKLGISGLAMRNLGELSGGQRQLVSIAQVLAREPEILMMDEPTSALDLKRQMQVLEFIRGLATERGLLIFLAIHDLNQVLRFADKVMVLAGGGLHAAGATREVLTADMLRRVYGVDARIETCSRGIPQIIVDGAVDETPA